MMQETEILDHDRTLFIRGELYRRRENGWTRAAGEGVWTSVEDRELVAFLEATRSSLQQKRTEEKARTFALRKTHKPCDGIQGVLGVVESMAPEIRTLAAHLRHLQRLLRQVDPEILVKPPHSEAFPVRELREFLHTAEYFRRGIFPAVAMEAGDRGEGEGMAA